ncbi:transcription antitermination regulator [Streptomyces ruber]|uniref:Transcription antitermination regulator n=2 Tax=Streptomyces TaxID=1883 RepID=A0A918BCS2_9ACTN|nr:ANTAR domain-containing protein [Streptomyces ruber]GGQ59419.1 transcription antitermination regulator [Streptomyces ruber]
MPVPMPRSGEPLPDPGSVALREELLRLREEARHLRARATGRSVVAQAQGILRERYALADAESAFALLQRASQRSNVKLRILAGAVLSVPRPEERERLWFPRRVRRPEPRLTFASARDIEPGNRGHVLRAVLSQTLTVVGSGMGNVQTTDHGRGGLRMEEHIGLPQDFVDFFGHVGDDGTSCALAAHDVAPVTVPDVATHPVFTEPARQAILRAGSRACHSVPLTPAPGVCVGMVSAHFAETIREPTPAQAEALAVVGTEAGRWLSWYDRTVVLDALEYLHALARTQSGARVRRR